MNEMSVSFNKDFGKNKAGKASVNEAKILPFCKTSSEENDVIKRFYAQVVRNFTTKLNISKN